MILLDLNLADKRLICGQVADSVKFTVVRGILYPGDLVPSVRGTVETACSKSNYSRESL
jgi:DNA-binding transcriptional regulator YhcF (GntR family)